ncbi:MAG: hypothetical protein K9M99_08945 [Candidatus Cloacimonetes bacterium]|nr:hypothetical protein [Candidatus Cloacimonadota bacterium]
MKKYLVIIIILLLAVCLPAQELQQKLETPGKLFVGTPFSLHIEITSAPEDSIFAPQLDSLDVFFLMGEPQQNEIIEDNIKKNQIKLTFQAFDTGDYSFPSLEFLVKTKTGEKILTTRDFVVIINSVLADSASAIKDIAKPVSLKLGFWDYFIPILSLIALIALIIILKKLLTKPKLEEEVPKFTDTRPPWQVAHEMLAKLKLSNLLDSGEFLEYYYQLSVILRYFLERNYQINALEMTTSEIRYHLKLDNAQEKNAVLRLLSESDKVKFAKYIPESIKASELTTWLDSYLLSFKLRSQEVNDA